MNEEIKLKRYLVKTVWFYHHEKLYRYRHIIKCENKKEINAPLRISKQHEKMNHFGAKKYVRHVISSGTNAFFAIHLLFMLSNKLS